MAPDTRTYADNQDELLIQVLDLEQCRDEQYSDWCESLEHLDERHAQPTFVSDAP